MIGCFSPFVYSSPCAVALLILLVCFPLWCMAALLCMAVAVYGMAVVYCMAVLLFLVYVLLCVAMLFCFPLCCMAV